MKKAFVFCVISCLMMSVLAACSCQQCKGTGEIDCVACQEGRNLCETCRGVGGAVTHCEKCDGDGYTIDWCSKCNKSGVIINPFTWEKFTCWECNGKLLVENKCDKCEGTGSLNFKTCIACDGDKYIECSECNGEGAITCPGCKGTGQV